MAEQGREAPCKANYFFQVDITTFTHVVIFFSTEGVKGTEGRQKHKSSEDRNYSVQYLARGNLNPPNANRKHPCFVQGAQETEFTLHTNATL